MRWAALLRGINLGGRRLLSADLKSITERLGYARVETLLASGNVVFDSGEAGSEIERKLEEALLAFGLKTDVMVRNPAELGEVIAANPYPDAVLDHPSHTLVTFHRDPFPQEALARLEPGPERLCAIGRELYVDYLSQQGMRNSRLPQTMAKAKFPKVGTARNWNTVRKLEALLAA